jgi:cell shape-determining protein MreC
MRIVTCIVILYACLSIIVPSFKPLSCFETTGLLFYQPWDILSGVLGLRREEGGVDSKRPEPDPASGGGIPGVTALSWWEGIARLPHPAGPYGLVGARSLDPIRPGQTRIHYYLGPSCPVRPGDPVIAEGALVGFVGDFEETSNVPVLLLNHKDSRSVVARVTGTVAGGKEVVFVAGGASQDIQGCIRIRILSDPFGLEEGSRAFTGTVPRSPEVPPGLFLGMVRIRRRADESSRDAALEPYFSPERLTRAAVLVPAERLDGERFLLPDLELMHVPARLRLLSPGRGRRTLLRISDGLEEGLRNGDLIVAEGYAVGRIDRVGLFSASGSLIPPMGGGVEAAVFPGGGPPRPFRFKVLERTGLSYRVEALEKLEGLECGMPVFLAGSPCSGLENYPALRVSDPGDGKTLCLEVPWKGGTIQGFCACPRLAQ